MENGPKPSEISRVGNGDKPPPLRNVLWWILLTTTAAFIAALVGRAVDAWL